jgi:hypothetical protein
MRHPDRHLRTPDSEARLEVTLPEVKSYKKHSFTLQRLLRHRGKKAHAILGAWRNAQERRTTERKRSICVVRSGTDE